MAESLVLGVREGVRAVTRRRPARLIRRRPGARGRGAHRGLAPRLTRVLLGAILAAGVAAPGSRAWAQPELFVTNSLANSVTVYARTAAGDVAPLRTLGGPATGLDGPGGLVVDPAHDELLVANSTGNAVTVYARTAAGDVAPLRTLGGPATGLSGPGGLVVDPVHDELLVANSTGNAVTVYPRAATGNVAPLRTLGGRVTGLTGPEGLAVDPAHDELLVANFGSGTVTVYPRTATGGIAPLRTLGGAATGLSAPRGLVLDRVHDELLVANSGIPSVTVYPRTATGNVAPLRILSGAGTGLDTPAGLVVDPVHDELFVVSFGLATVTVYPRDATGNTGPIRILGGATTGLTFPVFLAVAAAAAPVLVSTGTGASGGPHVKLFQFDPATATPTPLGGGFFAYDPGFTGGVQATLVRVGTDVYLVTGVGSGGGPHVKLFKVTDLARGTVTQLGPGFMAYDPRFTGGVRLAATTDAAGTLFIVTGVGAGGSPHVKVFEVTDLATGDVRQLGSGFFAYDVAFVGGMILGAWADPQALAFLRRELFVTNAQSVTVHSRTAGGNIAPLRTLAGAATGLHFPNGVFADSVHDELLVANSFGTSVTVYPLTATGNIAPLRTLAGAATGLVAPMGLVVDLVHDELLVTNSLGNSVTVYPRMATGNTAPLRVLIGAQTDLDSPNGLVVDTVHDELLVANFGNSVTVYPRTAAGDVAPLRTVKGPPTGLAVPQGLALDPVHDQLLVANRDGNSVTVYPRTATGSPAPLRALSGVATGLSSPVGLIADPVRDELLVANSGTSGINSVTTYPLMASGNVAPLRILSGAATGLNFPAFLAVATRLAPILISTGTGPSGGPHVKLFQFDPATATPTPLGDGFFAYDPGFTGGVQAAFATIGAGVYLVTGVGSGGGPHVKLFKVTDLARGTVTQLGPGFMAYDPGFTGGVRLAATTDAAGTLVIVTGVGAGGGAHVKVFEVTDLATGDVRQLGSGFLAYDAGFLGGVNVGAE